MARSQLKQLFVSMEEGEFDEEGNPVVINIDSDAVEITQTFTEAEDAVEDVEELEEVEEGLESIVASLEAALEQGGLDPISAQFAHHAVGAYVERLGMESSDLMPALESFGGDSGRISATTVSMETIGEALKKIWAAIKAAVEKAIKAVTDFFSKLFVGWEKLVKAAETLSGEIKKLTDTQVDNGNKMRVPNPNSLMVSNTVDKAHIAKGLNMVHTLVVRIYGNYVGITETTYKNHASHIKGLLEGATDVQQSLDTILSADTKLNDNLGGQVKSQDVMLGNKIATVTASKKSTSKGDNTEDKIRGTFSIVPVSGTKNFTGETEIDTPTRAELMSMLKTIMDIGNECKKGRESVKAINKLRKDIVDKDIKAKPDTKGIKENYDKVKGNAELRKAMSIMGKDYTRPITITGNYAFSSCRSVMSFVKVASKKYKAA